MVSILVFLIIINIIIMMMRMIIIISMKNYYVKDVCFININSINEAIKFSRDQKEKYRNSVIMDGNCLAFLVNKTNREKCPQIRLDCPFSLVHSTAKNPFPFHVFWSLDDVDLFSSSSSSALSSSLFFKTKNFFFHKNNKIFSLSFRLFVCFY